MRLALAAGVGLLLVAAVYAATRAGEAMPAAGAVDETTGAGLAGAVGDAIGGAVQAVKRVLGVYSPDDVPEQYRATIDAASARYGLPDGLLARLLWQESRFRPDVISGATVSPAGAVGIAQFMPATAAGLGVDPLDPQGSIIGAARYLGGLFAQFGNWAEALAAYNWGAGNVKRKGLDAAPEETRNYYTAIMADVGLA